MIESTESQVLYITEADLVRDIRAILQQVETGAEIIMNAMPNQSPYCVLRALYAAPYPSASHSPRPMKKRLV